MRPREMQEVVLDQVSGKRVSEAKPDLAQGTET